MIENIQREFITVMLEVMGIPVSEFVIMGIATKLNGLHPKHYNEIMVTLMGNENQYAKPIEKIGYAVQKTVDRHVAPNDIEGVAAFIKRQYRGSAISDHVAGVFKPGVKIAVSADGSTLVNLYNGQNLSEGDSISVYQWALENFDKLGKVRGYTYDHTRQLPEAPEAEPMAPVGIMGNVANLAAAKREVVR